MAIAFSLMPNECLISFNVDNPSTSDVTRLDIEVSTFSHDVTAELTEGTTSPEHLGVKLKPTILSIFSFVC